MQRLTKFFVCGIGFTSAALVLAGCGSTVSTKGTYGTITTVAGTGVLGWSGDGGPATSAKIYQPEALAFNKQGDLYISDAAEEVVRKVSAGVITTYAGKPNFSLRGSYSGNGGPAVDATFYGPEGLTVDSGGNLYVADEANNVIRVVNGESGVITAFAGNGILDGTPNGTYTGDGGAALLAGINHPFGMVASLSGDLYFCDTENQVVRLISASTGKITTIAGTGKGGYSGDGGPAVSAQLYNPEGLAFDVAGNLYIADAANGSIRKVDLSSGMITTVAGTGTSSGTDIYEGDGGQATKAQLSYPRGIAFDASGDLYIADSANGAVRKVVFTP